MTYLQNDAIDPKRTWGSLLDHLVGAGEDRRRDDEAQCFRGPKIDSELEHGRLLHREVGRLFHA